MEIDASLKADFAFDAFAQFGTVHAALGKRRPTTTAPCEELLYVHVGTAPLTDEDVASYARFHRSFVMHRVRSRWPHRFAMVYDISSSAAPTDLPAFLLRIGDFCAMQSDLGEHYKTLLLCTVVVVDSASAAAVLDSVWAMVGAPTQPVIAHVSGNASLADRLRPPK